MKRIGGWGVWSGTWEVDIFSKHYLYASSGGGQIVRNHSDPDHEVRFSYYGDGLTGSLGPVVAFRHSGASERIWLYIRSNKVGLAQTDDGVQSTLDENTGVTTANGTWYEFRIVADGPDVAVWRREKDGGGPWEEVLSTSSCTVTTTSRIWLNVNGAADFGFDDFFVLSDGLSNTTTFTYNGANELVSSTDYNFTTNYAYDEFGRLTGTTTVGGGPFTDYAYDYDDRLVEVAPNGQPPVTYQYGGDGLLRTRTHNGETTTLNWTGISVSSEEDAAGNIVRSYVGRSLAHIDGANPSTGDYRYYAHDHLYNTRALFDGAKANTSSYDFAPYGELLSPYANETNRLYTGHRLDEETAQYLTAYRWYDPIASRWHTQDPLGFVSGTNLYKYAYNAPTLTWDPDGRLAPWVVGGLLGAFGGGLSQAMRDCGWKSILAGAGIGGAVGAGVGWLAAPKAVVSNALGPFAQSGKELLMGMGGGAAGSAATTAFTGGDSTDIFVSSMFGAGFGIGNAGWGMAGAAAQATFGSIGTTADNPGCLIK